MKNLAATLCLFALSASAFAQTPLVRSAASTDISGDGKPDNIAVTSNTARSRFTLTINGRQLVVPHDSFMDGLPGFRIVRLSEGAKQAYIAVSLIGANDHNEHYFFLYDGKAIRRAGVLPGTYTAPGNGVVYIQRWNGFWMGNSKYAVGKNGVLQFTPQAGYYVGVSGTATQTFPIRVSPTKTGSVVANVSPNSKIDLLLFMPYGKEPVAGAESGYYLIKTQTGLCGWADFKSFQNRVIGLPYAG
ncbi:MAG: hypothetical protein H7145_12810 [Akkermansiaceae bacterium]|nr:hypothetical protein [Armatimonadota bacterium]